MRWGRIAELRELLEYSQADLARKSGVSQGYLSQLENGEVSSPGIDTLLGISNALRLPFVRFLHELGYELDGRVDAEVDVQLLRFWSDYQALSRPRRTLVRRLIETLRESPVDERKEAGVE